MVESFEFTSLVGPSFTYKSLPVDMQESVNFESVKVESPGSKYKSMLIGTPGSRKLTFNINGTNVTELPAGGDFPVRGMHRTSRGFGGSMDPATVVVVGKYVYEIKRPVGGVSETRVVATLPTSSSSMWSNRVSMADGGGESNSAYPPKLVIADGIFFHVLNMDDLSLNTLPNNTAPCMPRKLAFLDARVFAIGTDTEHDVPTNHVYWSGINDPSSWDASNFVSASVTMDPLVGIESVGNSLWLFGSDTYEIWQTTASSGTLYSPIRKTSGAANGVGCASAHSVAKVADKVFWVGEGDAGHGRIYMGTGTTVKYISTDAMEEEISHYDDLVDSVGFCYSEEGRTYYVVTFVSQDVTWVYSIENGCWHKRSTNNGDGIFHKWKFGFATYNWGRILVGSSEKNEICELSSNIYDDDGVRILRKRTSPHIVENEVCRHASFTLKVECGNALPTGEGSDPQVMLRALDGAGRYPRAERWKSTGRSGEYMRRVKWNSLGEARDRVYEIRVSAPIRWAILGATIDIERSFGGR